MNIKGHTIFQLAQYVAPYMGNFVHSLIALEKELKQQDVKIVYAFPESCVKQPWFAAFAQNHQVFLLHDEKGGWTREILDILKKVRPSIVHCHFDGYDVAAAKACKKYEKEYGQKISLVWHLHNVKGHSLKGLSKIKWSLKFTFHYGYFGQYANIISVSDEMKSFATKYRSLFNKDCKTLMQTIPNGIELSRCGQRANYDPHEPFTFFAMGGRNVQKRIDLLIEAAKLIINKQPVRLCITRGVDTAEVVSRIFDGNIPDWCTLVKQNDGIDNLFSLADCFVSTSVHETFSYGICEASLYGLPVIQSDIKGTMWNANNPSAFLFESENVDDLARVMLQVMNIPKQEMEQKCEVSKVNNAKSYCVEQWCERVIRFYEEM